MSTLVLYELERCPFCIRVRNKLDELGLDYESRSVPRRRAQRTTVEELSGQTGVPVLVDEDHDVEGMYESADIVRYLEETYGQQADARADD